MVTSESTIRKQENVTDFRFAAKLMKVPRRSSLPFAVSL
jgi:hypothetical protein